MQQHRFKKRRLKNWQVEEKEIKKLNDKIETTDLLPLDTFKNFPLSHRTLRALKEFNYINPTDIQKESIILALKGKDILGAARTGSGKTLAFLIPVLENLYRSKWTNLDGLGALIISPTRELAYQTFEVLKKIGKYHDFSAGIVIGGKDLNLEKQKISQTNILVATPGRLLQHLEQTTFFACDNLKILVLDEADRILDLGFQATVNSIIESIPQERQTLLFSATQTKSVKDLARLSLDNPFYVEAHENSLECTPSQLLQTYIVCELHEKISMLYSFIKTHLKQKILVFLTSCKQVNYVYNLFCRLKPGMSILALYGTMNQMKRVASYEQFSSKSSACLIATDIAARGLDFPEVHWVVQMDCSEDINTYIHRVGRTARYFKNGKALMLLTPSEEPVFVKYLQDKNIPCKKTNFNPNRILPLQGKLESECAKDVNLKNRAQKCFVSYLRAIFLMKDKKLFDITKLDTDKYAYSLGLAIPPRIRFLQKRMMDKKKVIDDQERQLAIGFSTTDEINDKQPLEVLTRGHKYGQSNFGYKLLDANSNSTTAVTKLKKSSIILGENGGNILNPPFSVVEDIDDQQLFNIKPSVAILKDEQQSVSCDTVTLATTRYNNNTAVAKPKSKVSQAKKLMRLAKSRNITLNKHVTFGEDDNSQAVAIISTNNNDTEIECEKFDIEEAKKRMMEQDILDKKAYRDRIKSLHKEKKRKEKESHKIKLGNKNLKKSYGAAVVEEGEDRGTGDYDDDGELSYTELLEEDPMLADLVDSLPDPDKVYAKADHPPQPNFPAVILNTSSRTIDDNSTYNNLTDQNDHPPPLRTNKKRKFHESTDNFAHSLKIAEQIAFKMIENNS